ncbi:hypothetical protein [Streptomyces sp. CA-132043]|uniref:hypothetical protein n=1 Tax=Streptomyces sp. CA-132043 TaxID=3240048 RepID=UPI003D8EE161
MLVSRLHTWGTTVEIEETARPAAAPDGEAVVAVEAAAVTHLDLTVMSGTFAYRPELPFTPARPAPARCSRATRRSWASGC